MIQLSEKVAQALKDKRPIVALESTIISHGMPYPQNVETALKVETMVRDTGAVPATIGIIDGVAVIGMSEEQIIQFGKRQGILKVSRRDLPVVYAKKMWGATTVAATMILSAQAGIEVFATGGIGGVHRGAEKTFDISADLEELARTDVTVVSAGAKSILDIGLTLEYLETRGVPVIGYQTAYFPAFFVRESPYKVSYQASTIEDIVSIIQSKREDNLHGGILVANPIPKAHSLNPSSIDQAIEKALKEMKKRNITGADVTPFLLKEVGTITEGHSLESNIALVLNNARVASLIAVGLSSKR